MNLVEVSVGQDSEVTLRLKKANFSQISVGIDVSNNFCPMMSQLIFLFFIFFLNNAKNVVLLNNFKCDWTSQVLRWKLLACSNTVIQIGAAMLQVPP